MRSQSHLIPDDLKKSLHTKSLEIHDWAVGPSTSASPVERLQNQVLAPRCPPGVGMRTVERGSQRSQDKDPHPPIVLWLNGPRPVRPTRTTLGAEPSVVRAGRTRPDRESARSPPAER